jgi:hypothetical protein
MTDFETDPKEMFIATMFDRLDDQAHDAARDRALQVGVS